MNYYSIDMEFETSKNPGLVITIDFGSYASGFALQWRKDYESNKKDIYCHKWNGGKFLSYKTVTCLLLKPDKTFKNFGHDAEKEFSELPDVDSTGTKKRADWYLFRHFKMALYNINEVTENTLVEDVDGKPLPMIDVFTPSIKYMMDAAKEKLKDSGLTYIEDSTKWILTVPAIWDESAKQIMRSCAEKAGIKGKYLSIALEPECAGVYCKQIPDDQLTLVNQNGEKKYIGDPDRSFMVLDIGGGTDDITTLQVNKDGTIRQIYKSVGGRWGGQTVDAKFYQMLENSIGQELWTSFCEQNREAELELRRSFECEKRQFCESEEAFKISIPSDLMDFLRADKRLKNVLQNGCEYFKIAKGRFNFPVNIIQRIFDETIEGMLQHIDNIVGDTKMTDISLDAIIVVGGFAESKYVVRQLRNALEKYDIPVLSPQNPEIAVLKGAILYGHNEKIITARVMRYTYGVGMVMKFDGNRNKVEKKFTDEHNIEWATDVFRKHVTVNEQVETGVWITDKDYFPVDKNQKSATVYVYSSTNEDPDHTTDEGCKYIGQFDISFPSDKAEIDISMYFSGTEIIIRAKDKKSDNVSYQTLQLA